MLCVYRKENPISSFSMRAPKKEWSRKRAAKHMKIAVFEIPMQTMFIQIMRTFHMRE